MTIGEKIKKRRVELGMTQSEVGVKAGCTYQTIVAVEKDRPTTWKTIEAVCETLKLKIVLENA